MKDWFDQRGLRDRSNPYWPLPKNYGELSETEQQLARLAVLRDHSTPEAFVVAWHLFRSVYLAGTKEVPFYKKGQQESPDFHYEMVYDLASHGRNADAAPRGFAKSTVLIEAIMLLLLTSPGYEIIYAHATDKLVEERFAQIRRQLEHNELIRQDFGVVQPKRGEALWSNHYLSLLNGSILKGLSVMGKKRGGRPNLFVLDDPENDPDSDSAASRDALTAKFETILFKQIIPMLEEGSCAFWIGTLIDRKSFLYRALNSDDPRFNYWNRKVYRARYEDEDGTRHLLWPAKWSWEMLDAREEEIGPAAFASEYLNNPIAASDRVLKIDEKKNEYEIEGEFDWKNPLANQCLVKWYERLFEGKDGGACYYEEQSVKFAEHVRPMFRFALFDYAPTINTHSDYSCIAICGMDNLGTLWVLDMWMGKASKDTLLRMLYEMGLKWQVRIVGIESAGINKDFMEAYQVYATEQNSVRSDNWIGRVFPIKYPAKETKPGRIASLEWRFNSARIKYPRHLKDEWPYSALYAQTGDFTMDLSLLPHDDAIDTISMSKHVIKSRGSKYHRERGKPTLVERILKEPPSKNGIPILSGVSSAEVDDVTTNVMSHKAREGLGKIKRRRRERPKNNLRRRR